MKFRIGFPLLAAFAASLCDAQVLFTEAFEDQNFKARGWYDNTSLTLSDEARPGSGAKSVQFRFPKGATTPASGAAIRKKFTPTEAVQISYYVKYSANWEGSNKPYHPHEIYLMTNLEDDWTGPAYTYHTFYVEQNEGVPMLSVQDSKNIDLANIGKNLTDQTEARAVGGCNGTGDRYPAGDCYPVGSEYRNGKSWRASKAYFQDASGKYYKADWHHVQASVRLNSIVGGKGVADGRIRYWLDGELVMEHNDVLLRTGARPNLKFTQFILAPYIGDGSPVEQSMWMDDLSVSIPDSAPSGIRMRTGAADHEGRIDWRALFGLSTVSRDALGRESRGTGGFSPLGGIPSP